MQTTTALAAVGAFVCLAATTHADPVTLDGALARATQRATVRTKTLDLDAARAAASGARIPLYNPELSITAGPLLGSGLDVQAQIGIAQTIERGGKRDARAAIADASIALSVIDRDREIAVARIEARRAFERALLARERIATRTEVEALATALAQSMARTALAGGTTKLRANLASVDEGRAKQDRLAAEADYARATGDLASAIGAGAGEVLEPAGTLADTAAPPLDLLVERALRSHPAIVESAAAREVATRRIADADARGVTDVTVGIAYAYSPDPDGSHAILASLSWPLAVRNANDGERAVARIAAKRAALDGERIRTEIERRVRLAHASYERARAALAGFDASITDHLADNLRAAQEAFAKGGLDFVELTTARRELVAARIAYLDARLAVIDARADLALAVGSDVAP